MVEETWKTVVVDGGEVYEDYEVSNLGRVRSLNYRKRKGEIQIIKQYISSNGYVYVTLHKNSRRKHFRVHRLVAFAFIPNDDVENKTDVNHKSEIKTDNRVENLEWCTRKENLNYGTHNKRMAKTKLNQHGKKVLCVENGIVYCSASECARQLGAYKSHICACCNGKRQTTKGLHFKFV